MAQLGGAGLRGMLQRGLVAWIAYVYLRVAGATGRY
jgi:cardiolipin synthase